MYIYIYSDKTSYLQLTNAMMKYLRNEKVYGNNILNIHLPNAILSYNIIPNSLRIFTMMLRKIWKRENKIFLCVVK